MTGRALARLAASGETKKYQPAVDDDAILDAGQDFDSDSDDESPSSADVVLPHLTLGDILCKKIFSWGRLFCVLGIAAGLCLVAPRPVEPSNHNYIAYNDNVPQAGDAYAKKVCARLTGLSDSELEGLRQRYAAFHKNVDPNTVRGKTLEELKAECVAVINAHHSLTATEQKENADAMVAQVRAIYGPTDNSFVWVFGLIALLIVLSVEGKPSEALLIFLSLAFRELGIIKTNDVFSGLGKQAPILFGSLFVISAAFNETRVLERLLSPIVGAPTTYWGLIFRLMLPVMVLSGVCANGPVCSMAMPLCVVACEQVGFNPKNFFLPLAYATSLGGLLTLIGSPPNLTVMSFLNSDEGGINSEKCCKTMMKIKGIPLSRYTEREFGKDSDFGKAYCTFSIFDPGFLITGAANCIVGALFLWISMYMLSGKFPSKQQIAEQAAKEAAVKDDSEGNTEKDPLVVQAAIDAVDGAASKKPTMTPGYLCDFVVRDFCHVLLGKQFASTPLGTTAGVTLIATWKSRKEYRAAKSAEAGSLDGAALTLKSSETAGAMGAGTDTVVGIPCSPDVAEGEEDTFQAGSIVRVSFKSADNIAKVRRSCEGLEPASKFATAMGRKRYKRLLFELCYDAEAVKEDYRGSVKFVTDEALFSDLQCVKVGYNEAKNVVLVEGFMGKMEKAAATQKSIIMVKQLAGTKPPRSVTRLDQFRGYFVFILFILAVVGAAISDVTVGEENAKWKPFERFKDIHTYFSIIAIVIVVTHILTWKNAVGTMSPAVLFTFAFAEGTAVALQKSGAVKLIADGVESVGESWLVVMILFFVALSVITQFINNNTTATLFQAAAFRVAMSMGIPPKPMLALVVFGASACFCTPFGTSCNMYVQAPGGYTFADYCKNGWMLQISSLIASVGCCWVWAEMLRQPDTTFHQQPQNQRT
ncbi:unnamed protein product [Amoebophrya sp. A25]|nr:unnamed protein product [Amoebophrya sp. A25]|eukprot:GSA25T00005335001.1